VSSTDGTQRYPEEKRGKAGVPGNYIRRLSSLTRWIYKKVPINQIIDISNVNRKDEDNQKNLRSSLCTTSKNVISEIGTLVSTHSPPSYDHCMLESSFTGN
jgi:hypothetical protein